MAGSTRLCHVGRVRSWYLTVLLSVTVMFIVYSAQEKWMSNLAADVGRLERQVLALRSYALSEAGWDSQPKRYYRKVLHTERNSSNLGNGNISDDEADELVKIYKKQLSYIKTLHIPKATTTRSCADEPTINRICVDTTCTAKFLQPDEENIRDLLRRQHRVPAESMHVINNMVDRKVDKTRISFVTALSANHFYESQALIKSLVTNVFPHLEDFRFYLYDLGLKPAQVQTIKKHCRLCRVRTFPFGELPAVFSNLKSYTWKPALIQAHLQLSEFVFWMDSSVRFLTENLTRVLETVSHRGILISSNPYSAPLHTDRQMYQYFNVEPCQMSPFHELEGTFLIFHNDYFTQNAIVTSWLACAFAPDCMYPFKETPAASSHYSCRQTVREYSTCHRFDQSALTTILSKIYKENVGYVILPKNRIHANKRGEAIKYFPE